MTKESMGTSIRVGLCPRIMGTVVVFYVDYDLVGVL